MIRIYSIVILILMAALVPIGGCAKNETVGQNDAAPSRDSANVSTGSTQSPSTATTAQGKSDDDHGHKPGAHGGTLVSLGRDSYHVEAIVTNSGELRLHTLGSDETRVQDIEIQKLIAFVKPESASESTEVNVQAQPQPGDAEGKASLFVGQLPREFVGKNLHVTIPNIVVAGERFRLAFTTKPDIHDQAPMTDKISGQAERELYLAPGGRYTQADIEANGNQTGSQKFAGFQPAHDLKPKVGDRICPITLTKSNPNCTWIVGGQTYQFCCPPCVDEFVALAKSKPDEIKQPADYVKTEAKKVQD